MATKIQFRRDTATNWSSTNPTLSQGELGLDLTNNVLKIGDGSTAWNSLTTTSKTATESYVDSKITTLINAAPGALDTLDELANALSDDADFAGTMTTALATKTAKTSNQSLSSAANAMTISGHTITLNRGDGTTDVVTVPDNNTTYSVGDGGLTQKNFTTTLKDKLDGIAASANNYTHPATHSISEVSGLQTSLDGKASTAHTHTGTYEPANSNIQSHVTSAHAPSNADNTAANETSHADVLVDGDVGTTANKLVQLDASAKLPAVDGSQLTNLPESGQAYTESATAPVSPMAGDEWFDTDTGVLFKYATDGVDGAWMDISTIQVPSGHAYTESTSAPTDPTLGDEWLNLTNGIFYKRVSDGVDAVWMDITGTGVASAGGGGGIGEFIGSSIAISSDDTALANDDGTDNNNIALGDNALNLNVTSDGLIAIGDDSMKNVTAGQNSVAIGKIAVGVGNTFKESVAIGYGAARSYSDVTGKSVYIGYETGYSGGGRENVGVGSGALRSYHSHKNTALGVNAGNGASGEEGVFVGYRAGLSGGGYSVCVGSKSGEQIFASSYHTYIGKSAGNYVNGGTQNTALGSSALFALGAAGEAVTQNTALGANALRYMQDSSNAIDITNSVGLGYDSRVSGDNQVQLGNSLTTTYAYGAVQDRSDRRDKADVADTKLGLSFINKLRPVEYRWDYREDYYKESEITIEIDGEQRIETVLQSIPKDGSKKRNRLHQGLIAQEVKSVMDELGVDFGGYQDHSINGGNDVQSIGYQELIAPMIKAIQELSARVEQLENKQ